MANRTEPSTAASAVATSTSLWFFGFIYARRQLRLRRGALIRKTRSEARQRPQFLRRKRRSQTARGSFRRRPAHARFHLGLRKLRTHAHQYGGREQRRETEHRQRQRP